MEHNDVWLVNVLCLPFTKMKFLTKIEIEFLNPKCVIYEDPEEKALLGLCKNGYFSPPPQTVT